MTTRSLAERRGASLWSVSLREAGRLLIVTLLAAAGIWALRADRLPLVATPDAYRLELAAPLVDIATALAQYDEGVHLFIDTRPDDDGGMVTIPGAFVIRGDHFDDDLLAVFDFLLPEDQLIVFGGGDLVGASAVATRLAERGYPNLTLLEGGLAAWRAGGGPTSPRETGGES